MNNAPTLILVVISLINGLISCSSSTNGGPLPAVNYRSSSLEGQVFEEVNRFRSSKGLKALTKHSGLSLIAKKHSSEMASQDKLDHSGYLKRATQAKSQFKLLSVSENIMAFGESSPTAKKLVQKWIDSPPHRKNMLKNFDVGGLSLVEKGNVIYGTFFFGKVG